MNRHDSFHDKQIIFNNLYIDCSWSNVTFCQLCMPIGAQELPDIASLGARRVILGNVQNDSNFITWFLVLVNLLC